MVFFGERSSVGRRHDSRFPDKQIADARKESHLNRKEKMMKKFFALMIMVAMFGTVACKGEEKKDEAPTETPETVEQPAAEEPAAEEPAAEEPAAEEPAEEPMEEEGDEEPMAEEGGAAEGGE